MRTSQRRWVQSAPAAGCRSVPAPAAPAGRARRRRRAALALRGAPRQSDQRNSGESAGRHAGVSPGRVATVDGRPSGAACALASVRTSQPGWVQSAPTAGCRSVPAPAAPAGRARRRRRAALALRGAPRQSDQRTLASQPGDTPACRPVESPQLTAALPGPRAALASVRTSQPGWVQSAPAAGCRSVPAPAAPAGRARRRRRAADSAPRSTIHRRAASKGETLSLFGAKTGQLSPFGELPAHRVALAPAVLAGGKAGIAGRADVRARLEKLGRFLARQLAVMELAGKIQAAGRHRADQGSARAVPPPADPRHPGGAGGRRAEGVDRPSWRRSSGTASGAAPPEVLGRGRPRGRPPLGHAPQLGRVLDRPHVPRLARRLPWSNSSRDRLDLRTGPQDLDTDHYDLEKIKERILEYLAVRKLKKDMKGPILCLVGPPGVGKTVARPDHRRGHGPQVRPHQPRRRPRRGRDPRPPPHLHRRHARPHHPGAPQGRHQQSPSSCSTRSTSSAPTSAATPPRRCWRCSTPSRTPPSPTTTSTSPSTCRSVMFIATANMLETIPPPLLDRMEILELPGYTEEEKIQIAQQLPGPQAARGARPGDAGPDVHRRRDPSRSSPTTPARRACATSSARSPPSAARSPAAAPRGDKRPHGHRRRRRPEVPRAAASFFREVADRTGVPGVATGLAWTPIGGEILFIEATAHARQGRPDAHRPARRVDEGVGPGRDQLPAQSRRRPWGSTRPGSPRPTSTSTSRPAPCPRTAPRPAWRSPRP